jgi:hypothetical protein
LYRKLRPAINRGLSPILPGPIAYGCAGPRWDGRRREAPSESGVFLLDTVDIDVARLRAMLALRGLRHGEFARQAHIGRAYCSTVLQGNRQAGELTRIRIARALTAHGISVEEVTRGS